MSSTCVRDGYVAVCLPIAERHPHQQKTVRERDIDHSKQSFFETLSYRFRCLRWICDDFVQSSLVDVTAKLRQRICYDMEILVLRVGVPLCMEAEVGRSHVGSHVRDMECFYMWRSVASNPQFEVALAFAITEFCFLAMSLDCCIRSRSCSLLFGIPAWRNWSLAL